MADRAHPEAHRPGTPERAGPGPPYGKAPSRLLKNPLPRRLLKKVQMPGGACSAGYPPKVGRRRTGPYAAAPREPANAAPAAAVSAAGRDVGPFQQSAAKPAFARAAQKGPDARRRVQGRLRRTPGTPQGVRERANAADGPFSAACCKTRFRPGCSKRSRCKAARAGPTEAYAGYAAGSARARQRRRWAFFSSLLELVELLELGGPVVDLPGIDDHVEHRGHVAL